MRAVVVVIGAYVVGSIPFSNLIARAARGTDLRSFGTRTASATSVYRLAGFGPMAVAGVLDIAKGAVGPALARPGTHPALAALAAGAAVCGHNWSIFMRGAGGRGISPALGATAVVAWPGTVVLALGLAAGRLARQTGFGCFVALLLLTPVLAVTRGADGALLGAVLVIPMLAKRAAGNARRPADGRTVVSRLVFDRDAATT